MKYDYTWRCDCDFAEGTCARLNEARRAAKRHLAECDGGKDRELQESPVTVFIDQYDLDAGEMSDKWWKVTKKSYPARK